MNDNPFPHDQRDYPEWLQREQDDAREREAEGRAKIGVAVLFSLLAGLIAMSAVHVYAGGLG